MRRTKGLIVCLTVLFVAVFAYAAIAGEFATLKQKVGEARESFVTMLNNKDKRGADQQKLVKETADAVSAMLSGMKAPAGKEAQFKELNDTWAAFKATRENELVPLVLAGKDEEAKKIAGGVQKERMGKINALCDELDK